MDYYAGIDVSLEYSSVCVVDANGKIIREAKVVSEPAALMAWFGPLGLGLARIGLEAGPLSQWLYAAMKQAGLAVELLETRHVSDAFKAMPVKSDRNDARKIAQLMRLGWFRPVHCKSIAAQEIRAMLTARKLVQSQAAGPGEQPARDFARLRAEGRQDDADKLCRTHRRAGEGSSEPSDDRGGAASGAGRSACRVQRF
jgi:hypothetical protein